LLSVDLLRLTNFFPWQEHLRQQRIASPVFPFGGASQLSRELKENTGLNVLDHIS